MRKLRRGEASGRSIVTTLLLLLYLCKAARHLLVVSRRRCSDDMWQEARGICALQFVVLDDELIDSTPRGGCVL